MPPSQHFFRGEGKGEGSPDKHLPLPNLFGEADRSKESLTPPVQLKEKETALNPATSYVHLPVGGEKEETAPTPPPPAPSSLGLGGGETDPDPPRPASLGGGGEQRQP